MITLTAESVAQVTKRGLLSVTMGEIHRGYTPWYFERQLKKILQYATIWEAIVLLDEADVFLEGRSDKAGVKTEHNGLVAIFLKHLEYFSGIVFLTSNRVRVFDQAMTSRIHLALEYKTPNHDMRRRIWTKYLAATPADELDLDIDEDVDNFLLNDVNGREIANCVNTARTLARFKGEKLQSEHIQLVLDAKQEFEKTVKKIKEDSKKRQGSVAAGAVSISRSNTLEMGDD
jgi:SpoVK/Ycf46/Vps4 family AAA+-type ATPase